MHSNTNPFQPGSLEQAIESGQQLGVDFAPILHRWERYRLWYNSALILYTLGWSVLVTPDLLLDGLYWFQLVFLGMICNLCFFLGPAIEAYGRYFAMWNSVLSMLLFLAGLMLTGLLDTAFLIARGM